MSAEQSPLTETAKAPAGEAAAASGVGYTPLAVSSKKNVHHLLGGGKGADILLWRNPVVSGSILGGVFLAYILFEWSGYTLLTLVANILLVALIVTFVWSYVAGLLGRSPPPLPRLDLSDELVDKLAREFRIVVNMTLRTAREVALAKDYVLFVKAVFTLYVVSVIGSWFNFLTLVFVVVLLTFSLPKFYEQYHTEVDKYVGIAKKEVDKYYALFEEKVLKHIPRAPKAGKAE